MYMEGRKKKVIIDCDPGIDDSLAIILALNSPEIEVAAFLSIERLVSMGGNFKFHWEWEHIRE